MRSPIWLSHVAGALLCAVLPAGAQQAANSQPRQRNVITAEEIERLNAVEDAYQVVLRLRPEFLRAKPRAQLRSPGATERQMPQDLGRSKVGPPSFSARAAATGAAPNPDAPEFTNGQVSGRTTSPGGGGANAPGVAAGGPGAALGSSIRSNAPGAPNGDAEPFRTEDTGIAVYVGNVMYGGADELTRVLAANVREIRYLSPSEAQFRFGPRHDAGVIVVTLK
jgi:hypothetical protein